jgi:hypothetical protein
VEAGVLPAALEAVSVYTVVDAGVIARVPLTATFPIPLSILADVAPVTVQLSVELPPDATDGGLALKELITGFSLVVLDEVQPGKYMKPHVNTTIEMITNNSFFIFLPYLQVECLICYLVILLCTLTILIDS